MKIKSILTVILIFIVLIPGLRAQTSLRNARSSSASGILPAKYLPSGKVVMDFDSLPDFSLTFGSWLAIDKDGQVTYGIQDHVFPHSGQPMAYIVFNPAQVTPSMASDTAIQPHSGAKFAASFSAETPPNNDWLISPKIQLKYDGTVSFWARSYTSQYGLERFRVAVSVSDSNPSSFTVISGPDTVEAPAKWTKYTYHLSSFNNQKVYVAVNCVSKDAFIFMLDDIEIDPGSDTPALPSSILLNFDTLSDFTLDFYPWTTTDVGGGLTYAITNVSFPNEGVPMAWINFNPSQAIPPPANMTAHSGSKFGACFSSMPPNNPNNKWLISPHLQLGVNSKVDLWAMTYNSAYGFEKYNVCVSTAGNSVSEFSVISQTSGEQAPDNWSEKSFDLSAYDGLKVYVAIQCITNNGFVLMMDDISITSTLGIEDHSEDQTWHIYPNPSSGIIYLEGKSNFDREMKFLLMDISGKIIRELPLPDHPGNRTGWDLSFLSPGVYLLKETNGMQSSVKKLVITR